MTYRATIRETETGRELIVFPRTRKTTLFPTVAAATKALDAKSKTIGQNGWIGRIYEINHAADNGRRLITTIAI